MSCPMEPTGIAATCDWALLVPCLFGDITKPPKTVFVHTLMLPVSSRESSVVNLRGDDDRSSSSVTTIACRLKL